MLRSVALAGGVAGCTGPQSALVPAGRGAERIGELFWGMTIGFSIIWIAVVGLALYAYSSRKEHSLKTARRVIVGGGVVLPIVVLTGLLAYGLAMMPSLLPSDEPVALKIRVIGHQYWWRVQYLRGDGVAFELANEIHLPVDERVELSLESRDVIHSLWIPSLGGKVDMIPGRTTRLVLEPTRRGLYRGTCAEYCGTAHALMSFYAIVEDRPAFDRWLVAQESPAAAPAPTATRGAEEFVANGCGACHAIRGTSADGVIGPDLTHVGSRHSIAAGILTNDRDALRRWIARTTHIKPNAGMPSFAMLPHETIDALAIYLGGLR